MEGSPAFRNCYTIRSIAHGAKIGLLQLIRLCIAICSMRRQDLPMYGSLNIHLCFLALQNRYLKESVPYGFESSLLASFEQLEADVLLRESSTSQERHDVLSRVRVALSVIDRDERKRGAQTR